MSDAQQTIELLRFHSEKLPHDTSPSALVSSSSMSVSTMTFTSSCPLLAYDSRPRTRYRRT